MKKLFSLIAAILILSCSTSSDDNGNSNTTDLPTLTTATVSLIAVTTAASGGTISSDGGAVITAKGVCWSTSANPTVLLTTKTNDGAGTGTFISNITGLLANTMYYVRAYATNSAGTAYGNEVSFTTRQNASLCDDTTTPYPTVTIGGQVWMQKNLNVCKYRNGDDIPQVQDLTAWVALTTGAWCYYENNTVNGTVYGKLYNWYAVNDPRGLAPTGYHVPSDAEWTTLTTFLGGESVAGNKMKAITGWTPYSGINNTNSSGFTGLPSGLRYNGGTFDGIGGYGSWWSSSEDVSTGAWFLGLQYNGTNAFSYAIGKEEGLSVRCVKD